MRIAITGATGPADQYKQALARASDSVAAVKQHQSLLKSADEKRADEALLAWLAEHPEDGIARSYLAESFLRRANESSAIQQYEALLAHEPTNRSALNNLAFLYQRKGDARALPLAKKLYELEPDTAAYADTLGWILYRQGDKSEGLKLLEKASVGAPSNPEIRLHLAEILLDTNQAPRARQEIDTLDLEELDPAQKRRVQQLLDRLP
jgi:predicted Zn-dependent protease